MNSPAPDHRTGDSGFPAGVPSARVDLAPQPENLIPEPTRAHAFTSGEAFADGLRDTFLERRFRDSGEVDTTRLYREGKIAFLGKAVHTDELYRIEQDLPGLPAGQYRIRNVKTERPFLTRKSNGDGINQPTETIDIIDPPDALLDTIRKNGEFLAVIVKFRRTYQSKTHPQCLLHIDTIPGLGDFYDLKGDKRGHLDSFVSEVGLGQATPLLDTYLSMKAAQGISPAQLRIWQVQQKMQDYVMGIVSGTLTPLGFIIGTAASGAPKSITLLNLMLAAFSDGWSDAVGEAQTTQSESNSKWSEQVTMFFKTMAAKVVLPSTYLPIVIFANQGLQVSLFSSLWAAAVLGSVATIQAVAAERPVKWRVGRSLLFGGGAVLLGYLIGEFGAPLLSQLASD
jgi:adenylate cyclase class IV